MLNLQEQYDHLTQQIESYLKSDPRSIAVGLRKIERERIEQQMRDLFIASSDDD